MKLTLKNFLLIAVPVCLISCGKKETVEREAAAESSVTEQVVDKIEEIVAKIDPVKLTTEERAAKLGFAKYLPTDTEVVMSFHDMEKSAEQMQALKLWGVMRDLISASTGMGGGGFDFDDDMIEEGLDFEQADDEMDDEMAEGAPGPWMLFGREFTVALGKTSGEQTANLLRLNRRYAFFQSKLMARQLLSAASEGDAFAFDSVDNEELIREMLADPDGGVGLLERSVMPPLYFAFRAKDGQLEETAQLVAGSMAIFEMAGEMAEAVDIETGGATLSGFKVLGAKIVETLEDSREEMEAELGVETTAALLAAVGSKDLFVVTGTIGDYVVACISGTEEGISLVDSAGDSLVAGDALIFSDAYADKPLLAMIYGEKELWTTLMEEAGGLADYALGIKAGLAGGEGLGDTRDIEAMLQIVADRERALQSLASSDTLGMIAFVDDGLKIESFGGYDDGSIDWKSERVLSHLGDSGDNLLFFNGGMTDDYSEKVGDYFEALLETAYAITMKVSEVSAEGAEFEQFKGFAKLFDDQFREDVVAFWEAMSGDFAEGLGAETAMIIDLKGAMPAIPGIPQTIVDNGKAPRISLISPVEDRVKLASAWEKMNATSTTLLAKLSEMSGTQIPMQRPMNSEKDDFTTWFFSFPFFSNDFLPSVTVGDKWFAASTSRDQALDLLTKAEVGGPKGDGWVFSMNFTALQAYADETLKMVDANKAELFAGNEFALESFEQNKVDIEKLIDALGDFDQLSVRSRLEGGQMRSSVHFKTK